MQPLLSMIMGGCIFKKIALDLGLLHFIIVNVPTVIDKPLVHALKCIMLSFWTYIVCILGAISIKYVVYKLIGLLYDCEPTTAMDDFWFYDLPINPINIPIAMVIDKPQKDPSEMLKQFIANQEKGHRCSVKHVKLFGKYFLKKLSDEEYAKWLKTNTGVVHDVKTEDELLDFMLKIKKVHTEKIDKSL